MRLHCNGFHEILGKLILQDGRIRYTVWAKSPEEAYEKAAHLLEDEDFCELHVSSCTLVHVRLDDSYWYKEDLSEKRAEIIYARKAKKLIEERARQKANRKQYSDVYCCDACYSVQKEDSKESRNDKYRKYQLDWLYDHGYSVDDVLRLFAEYVAEFVEDEEEKGDILSAPRSFLMDRGFNGECFACEEEFFDCEGSII